MTYSSSLGLLPTTYIPTWAENLKKNLTVFSLKVFEFVSWIGLQGSSSAAGEGAKYNLSNVTRHTYLFCTDFSSFSPLYYAWCYDHISYENLLIGSKFGKVPSQSFFSGIFSTYLGRVNAFLKKEQPSF